MSVPRHQAARVDGVAEHARAQRFEPRAVLGHPLEEGLHADAVVRGAHVERVGHAHHAAYAVERLDLLGDAPDAGQVLRGQHVVGDEDQQHDFVVAEALAEVVVEAPLVVVVGEDQVDGGLDAQARLAGAEVPELYGDG